MKASLFTLILATTVVSGHAAFAVGGLNKHDASIAQYSYSLPIIDTSTTIAASGSSLRDDMDKGYKPEPAPVAPALQPTTAGTGYKPSVPAPAARQPGSGYKPSVPAPAAMSPRVEAAPKAAPAMPAPVKDSNAGNSAAADIKVDANTNANINSNVTSSATAAPLATPDAIAKEVAPPATATKPVAPGTNNAAFGNVLNPVPATPATAPVTTNTPTPAAVVPAPQSSATPPVAPAVTGTNGITVSGTGTSTPAGSSK